MKSIAIFASLFLVAIYVAPISAQLQTYPQSCNCSAELRPVCVQERTFPNECLYECQHFTYDNPPIVQGDCPGFSFACPWNIDWVCGVDGVSYVNPCVAKAYGTEIASNGKCADTSNPNPKVCSCTKELSPVCGADGITYGNKCLAECAGTTVINEERGCDVELYG